MYREELNLVNVISNNLSSDYTDRSGRLYYPFKFTLGIALCKACNIFALGNMKMTFVFIRFLVSETEILSVFTYSSLCVFTDCWHLDLSLVVTTLLCSSVRGHDLFFTYSLAWHLTHSMIRFLHFYKSLQTRSLDSWFFSGYHGFCLVEMSIAAPSYYPQSSIDSTISCDTDLDGSLGVELAHPLSTFRSEWTLFMSAHVPMIGVYRSIIVEKQRS